MKVVAFNGSPRKGGNTEIMLKKVLEPIAAAGIGTELVQVGGKKIQGCIACYKCFENKNMACAVDNDIFNDCFAKIAEADAVIIGSPTYFADVSAHTKALLDRTGLVGIANDRCLKNKIGAAVAPRRRGGAIHVFDTINHMYLMSEMIVPGSLYWNIGAGREKGEVMDDEEGMANMVNLGERIAWLVEATASKR